MKDYEKHAFRFVSEFGMQSYSSPETNALCCPAAGDGNVFGPVMDGHQKSRAGNQIILEYVSRRYRFPKSQDDLIYLSQINQAHCLQVGVEHYRRQMPRGMGALYWQLNDCWPAASWSSIEFGGKWKALHYAARRFFAPIIVTAHVPGEGSTTIGNYHRFTPREVHLYTISDAPTAARGVVRWDLFHLNGTVLQRGHKKVTLRPGESRRQQMLDLAAPLTRHGRDSVVLRIALDVDGERISGDSVFFSPPRFLDLPKTPVAVQMKRHSSTRVTLTFRARVFHHRVAVNLGRREFRASDNFFELFPNEAKSIVVDLARPITAAELRRCLTYRSLADTY